MNEARTVGARGPARTSAWAVIIVAAAALAGLGGCSTNQAQRPMLEQSAVQASAVPAGGAELEFFDTLASRRLVCHDDVIHAGLLLQSGESAPEYSGRVAMAQGAGLLDGGFDRPALEAATIGEVSQMLVRICDGPEVGRDISQVRAVSRLVTRGWLPGQAKAYQGLTGGQLVTLISAAGESMASGERAPEPSAIARARPEPLAIPPEPTPAPPSPPSRSTPSATSEASAAAKPVEPAPRNEKPTIWIKGTPLKRPNSK